MKIYIPRLLGYMGILLMLYGVMMLPVPNNPVLGPFVSAVVWYLPMSLLWIPISRLLYHYCEFSTHIGKVSANVIFGCFFFLGIICSICFAWLKNAELLEIGIFMMLLAGDGVLTQREWETVHRAKSLSTRP